MNLLDYVRIILRRGWIVVILALLAAVAAYLFSRAQTPIYRASQKILLQPSRTDYGLAEATTRLLRSYVVWLDSDDQAGRVIDALQLDMIPADLRSHVTVDTDESRMLIQIDVDLPDGELANRVARQWGELFVQWRNEQNQRARYEDRIDASLVDYPAYGQIRPNVLINVAAGGVLGVLLGGVIVFVLEYLESNIIRRQDDVTRSLEIAVLGAIPADETRASGA